MKQKKIILSVTNNLETDQRVHKVASSLHENGFEVLVVGTKSRKCNPYKRNYGTQRMPCLFKKGFLFYAEYNIRLFFLLLFSDCDILTANDTDTLVPNFIVAKIRRKKLVVDLHELFPEVPEVVSRPFVKKVWESIEAAILPRVSHGYTVCESIASYYKERYGTDLKVVRNIPMKRHFCKKSEKLKFDGKKIILYQGAVNVGRGIEWIMEAMPMVENAVFVVIGRGDLFDELSKKAEEKIYQDKVFFLGHVPYSELFEYTCSADLGTCLLEANGLSYYFSLPNRIFDYMQAHVPIIATDFPEIRKVVSTYKTGRVTNSKDPKVLAKIITEMLNEKVDDNIFENALANFSWEKEAETLIKIYK